jgi:hypothetical protein
MLIVLDKATEVEDCRSSYWCMDELYDTEGREELHLGAMSFMAYETANDTDFISIGGDKGNAGIPVKWQGELPVTDPVGKRIMALLALVTTDDDNDDGGTMVVTLDWFRTHILRTNN